MRPTKIINVKKIGKLRSLDIEVANEDHLFVANGLICSNSHAYGYAVNNYIFSAYPKAHFPRAFYIAQMEFAKDVEEIGEFVKDARDMGVVINKPDIRRQNPNFCIIKGEIYYGLKNIKGIGEGINPLLEKLKSYTFSTWNKFLFDFYNVVNIKVMTGLISAGALDFFGITRNRMLYDLNIVDRLNDKQFEYCQSTGKSLEENIDEMISLGNGKFCPCKTKVSLEKLLTTKSMLANPPFSLEDSHFDLEKKEKEFLGVAFSGNEIDGSAFNDILDDTCQTVKDAMEAFKAGEAHKSKFKFIAKIIRVNPIKTRNAEEMAFVEFGDADATIDNVTCFPGVYQKYKNYLYTNNKLLISGSLTKAKGYNVGFSIDTISQI